MSADFSYGSSYHKEANFSKIKFGADAPLLETELNEMQDIMLQKVRDALKTVLPNSLISGTIAYSNGSVTVTDATFVVDGDIVFVPTSTIGLLNGESLYLRVFEKEATLSSTLRQYGYESGNQITNNILDTRIGYETSRRAVIAFELVKVTGLTGTYLKLANITNGTFSQDVKKFGNLSTTNDTINSMFVDIS
jgi:hypothetical protein